MKIRVILETRLKGRQYTVEIKDRLKQIRIDSKLSQEQFGKEVGLTKGTVSKFENGKAFPGRETLEKVSKKFNVTIDYLYGESKEIDLNAHKYKKFKEIIEWLEPLPKDEKDIALEQMLSIAQALNKNHTKPEKK